MFSARLGFMRPDSVTEPDGGVPDEITSGNILYQIRANEKVFLDTRAKYNTNPVATQFSDRLAENWIMTAITIGGEGTSDSGVSRLNGIPIDTALKFGVQGDFTRFTWGSYESFKLKSDDRQGVPHVVTDIFFTNSALDVSDIEKCEGYIAHNSGLKKILAGDHTYKNSAPQGFTPDDLNPVAWFNANQGFDNTDSTWLSTNGDHSLASTNRGITSGAPELAYADTHENVNVIRFPNSRTSWSSGFAGCKYQSDNMVNGKQCIQNGMTFIFLYKFFKIPGIWDENWNPFQADNQGGWGNLFGFNTSTDIDKPYVSNNEHLFNISYPNFDAVGFSADSGSDADVANASVDTGNVSV